jgi:MFS superfamily sulfate permease-like transporter
METLISAKIAGFRTRTEFSTAIETRGLSIAHLVCGIAGAMPPTGVFVRTSVNYSLGATHRISEFMNAIIVMIITLSMMPAFAYLPIPIIAAVLFVASARMVPFDFLYLLYVNDKPGLAICLVTAVICFIKDPVIGASNGLLFVVCPWTKFS